MKMNVPLVWCQRACGHRPAMPSMAAQAKSFAMAAGRHIKGGMKIRPEGEIERVKKICSTCDQFIINGNNPRCRQCGCYLNIKARWENADCPLKKWNLTTFICCVASIGDLICVEPFVRYYKSIHPEANVQIVSRWPELFSRHPDITESLGCNGEQYPNYPDPKLWYSIDPADHITQWMPKFNKMWIPDGFDRIPRLYLDEGHCESFLARFAWDFGQPYVAVNPHTSTSIREWSWDKWRQVVERLQQAGLKVVQMGRADSRRIDGIDCDMCGTTTDLQLAGILIQRSRFFLGMDSGTAHLAAAVGKKAVIIFGSGREAMLCHEGYTYPVVGKTNLAQCDICQKERFRSCCDKNPLEICMSMSVDEVWEEVEKLL